MPTMQELLQQFNAVKQQSPEAAYNLGMRSHIPGLEQALASQDPNWKNQVNHYGAGGGNGFRSSTFLPKFGAAPNDQFRGGGSGIGVVGKGGPGYDGHANHIWQQKMLRASLLGDRAKYDQLMGQTPRGVQRVDMRGLLQGGPQTASGPQVNGGLSGRDPMAQSVQKLATQQKIAGGGLPPGYSPIVQTGTPPTTSNPQAPAGAPRPPTGPNVGPAGSGMAPGMPTPPMTQPPAGYGQGLPVPPPPVAPPLGNPPNPQPPASGVPRPPAAPPPPGAPPGAPPQNIPPPQPLLQGFNPNQRILQQRQANGYGQTVQPYGGTPQNPKPIMPPGYLNSTLANSGLG